MFDLSWPVTSQQHTFWTFVCFYHLQYTIKRAGKFCGLISANSEISPIAYELNCWGLEECPLEGCWLLAVCFCSLGICWWPWGEKSFLAGVVFDHTSRNYFYRKPIQRCWSGHNSALFLWFKSDALCLLNKASVAVQVEKRDGLLIIALPFSGRAWEDYYWSSISCFPVFQDESSACCNHHALFWREPVTSLLLSFCRHCHLWRTCCSSFICWHFLKQRTLWKTVHFVTASFKKGMFGTFLTKAKQLLNRVKVVWSCLCYDMCYLELLR